MAGLSGDVGSEFEVDPLSSIRLQYTNRIYCQGDHFNQFTLYFRDSGS